MKRFLVGLIILVAVVLLGGHYFYAKQIGKRLDRAAMVVSGMGGELDYRDIKITLDGEVRIEGLFFQVPGMGGALNVDRVAVHTGGPLGVHSLAMDIRDQQLPKTLGVSFEGVRFPLSSGAAMSPVGFGAFTAAGCGDRNGFGTSELVQMGYSGLVMDARVDYRFIGGGQLLNVTVDSLFRDMHRTEVSMELSLGASSLNAMAVGMAASNAELLGLTIDYQDMGYAKRVFEFCQKETELDRQAFIAQHLEAWEQMWQRLGFVAGPTMTQGYRNFLAEPDQLSLSIEPNGELSMDELSRSSPEMMLYQLRTTLSVNHDEVGRLDLSVREGGPLVVESEAETATGGDSAAVTGTNTGGSSTGMPSGDQRIALDNLDQHLNRDVELHLQDGRALEGRVEEVRETSVQFKRFHGGGYVIQPIPYDDIEAVYLRDNR
ncbi:hypothetical protein [Marinimicrobium agarilyticum]|uniref:hypothetical protein n=1 Tax=Marinimicrobium agarilyticum TaxID=306546 RepID=UPI0004141DC9|nr:hypothetical protein [Marinimicrobium agarilyticum]